MDINGVIFTCILSEADGEGGAEDLLLEEILLVEEEDDRGVTEPFVVANRVEQFQTLLHSILGKKTLVKQDIITFSFNLVFFYNHSLMDCYFLLRPILKVFHSSHSGHGFASHYETSNTRIL